MLEKREFGLAIPPLKITHHNPEQADNVFADDFLWFSLLCALERFTMKLHLSKEEIASVQPIEKNCARHLAVVNDIMSWEKELAASRTGHPEGAAICSAVQVLADETSLPVSASKRILWMLCREWELQHEMLVAKRQADVENLPSGDLMLYIKGLEYQISGNELWSKTSRRYTAHIEQHVSQ